MLVQQGMNGGMNVLDGTGAKIFGAPSFSPTDLAGLVAWYVGDLQTYVDAALTTPATTNGATVAGWKDQSGLSHHVTTPVVPNVQTPPILQTNIINGHSAVKFGATGGVDTDALAAAFTWSQPRHTFLAIDVYSWDSSKAYIVDGQSANIAVLKAQGTAQHYQIYGGTAFVCDVTGPANNTWFIIESLWNGASSQQRVNAGSASTGDPGNSAVAGVTLGQAATGTGGLRASGGHVIIAEAVGYNVALSDANATKVRNYLNARYLIF